MKTELDIIVPNDWSAVTLKDYLELQRDIETYKDDENAYMAVLFYRLCGVSPKAMQSMDIKTFNDIAYYLYSI